MAKTDEERIAELDEQIRQMQARKKAIQQRMAQAERKARTKRLIEIGATVEGVLGREIWHDDLPKLASFLTQQEDRGGYFSKAMGAESREGRED